MTDSSMTATVRSSLRALAVVPAVLLSGCDLLVLHPAGEIARQQGHLILVSTVLMLLIVVPVLALTLLFAWRYRASNTRATYTPDWDHSTALELLIWSAPLLIIIALGAMTWISTHTLDPYRPVAAGKPSRLARCAEPVRASEETLVVEVVALDWKWLFIYPDQGVASVNELAAPVNVPIHFKITSSSVMNSFFIPALAGQIYAMPGMQTELNAVINNIGTYDGFSANYSGAGFSGMRFKFYGMSRSEFDDWVTSNRKHGSTLTDGDYRRLAKPSEREPVHHYASVADGLYASILKQCLGDTPSCSGAPTP
jgi:cytochrome o ubiquinol oxidase subunit 2